MRDNVVPVVFDKVIVISRCDKVSRYSSRPHNQVPASTCSSYQVNCDGCTQQPPAVDVHRMVPELDDPGETSQDGQHDEGEDQERLEQLGRVGQHRVEVHLQGRGAEEPLVSSRTEETVSKPQEAEVLEVIYCAGVPNESASFFNSFSVSSSRRQCASATY